MFKVRPVGTSAKLKPIEKVETEMSSVELIAELIEIELQELTLDVVIRVKNASLGIADGNMHPWENFPHKGLVLHDIRIMIANNAEVNEGYVRTRSIRSRLCLVVNGRLYLGFFGGSLQVRNDHHLYMADPFAGTVSSLWSNVRPGTLRHNKYGCLPPAATSTLDEAVFLISRRFCGKEALVKLNLVKQPVKTVALAHDITQLVHHLPYRPVTFSPQLALNLLGGYGTLGTGNKVHGDKPVEYGKLAALHDSPGAKRCLIATILTCPGLVAGIPTQMETTAFRAKQCVMLTKLSQGMLTCLFVWIYFIEIYQIHIQSFPFTDIMQQVIYQSHTA